jgi:putative aldouronate transport system substrate-binding protein
MKTHKKLRWIVYSVILILCFNLVFSTSFPQPASAKNQQTLTYWVPINSKVAPLFNNYASIAVYQIIMKKFNVKIEFQHPPIGGESDQFNLMIASGKLPDIIEWHWDWYPGGPVKALQDKVVIRLNEYIDKYAPNYKKYLQSDPDAKKLLSTDNGDIYCYGFVREKQWQGVYYGPQLRRDWLKKLGLNPPETLDEWYKVLKAFKTKDPNGNGKADELPFSMASNPPRNIFNDGFIIGAYGILPGFYVENGKVKYGALQPQFKTFMQLLQKWYKEGLFDPGIFSPDSKRWEAKILSNEIGSFLGLAGGNMAKYLTAKKNEDPNFDLVGVSYPVLKKGQTPAFGQMDWRFNGVGAALTPKCRNIQLAMKILDWGYSKEGYLAYNFGIEGKTYVIKNGKPVYTDEIIKNPQGLDPYTALAKYGRACYDGPFVQSEGYAKQLLVWPQQWEAVQNWSKSSNKNRLPPVTLTPEESQKVANIMNNVNTYYNEMFSKMWLGKSNDFNGFVKTLQRMRIEEAIKIYQQAYNRYLKR